MPEGVISNIESGSLADRLRRMGLITRPQLPLSTQISVPIARNSQSLGLATPAFTMTLLDGPAILYSYAVLADSNTVNNFQMLPYIGISQNTFTDQSNNPLGFSSFPTGGSFNPIPEGTGMFLPATTKIALYVYYNGTSGTAGIVNISISLDSLGTTFDPSRFLSRV